MSERDSHLTSQGPNDADAWQPPAWLEAVVRRSRSVVHAAAFDSMQESLSAQSQEVLRQAGRIALELARLRAERERMGFAPLPVVGYVRAVAKRAQVALEPVLAWAGIQ